MYVNGHISYQRLGTSNIYTITEDGKHFLNDYQRIKGKIMEFKNQHPRPIILVKKKAC
jgi:predicted transcriptional regulator